MEFENQTFKKVALAHENLKHKTFLNCTFENCDFTKSDLTGAKFLDCKMVNCNLSLVQFNGCRLQNLEFNQCKFVGVNFGKSDPMFLSLKFAHCLIEMCNFSDLNLKNTPFLHCTIRDTHFTNANLSESDFSGSDLKGSTFHNSNLCKHNFVGSNQLFDQSSDQSVKKCKIFQARSSSPLKRAGNPDRLRACLQTWISSSFWIILAAFRFFFCGISIRKLITTPAKGIRKSAQKNRENRQKPISQTGSNGYPHRSSQSKQYKSRKRQAEQA